MALTQETNLKLVATTITALSALIQLKDSPSVKNLQGSIKGLIDQLTPTLPRRADGQPWTPDDIHAAAKEARSWFQAVVDRSEK